MEGQRFLFWRKPESWILNYLLPIFKDSSKFMNAFLLFWRCFYSSLQTTDQDLVQLRDWEAYYFFD